jgi:hypothetical protein
MTSSNLEDVAVQLATILEQHEYVLIGGLAVAAHGYVRATVDVDFVVRDLDAACEHLREQGLSVEVLRGDFTCVRGSIGAIRFDLLPPLVPIRWDRAIRVPLGGGTSIRVVDLESLIRLKLKAGGPRDLMDVAALVLRHPEQTERAREIALAYRLRAELETWLSDPRLKAELAEAGAAEGDIEGRRAPRLAKPALARPGRKKTPHR